MNSTRHLGTPTRRGLTNSRRLTATVVSLGVALAGVVGGAGAAAAAPVTSTAGSGVVHSALTAATDPTAGRIAYVTGVYRDLFGRAPDAIGLQDWTARLRGGTPRAAVANAITSSAEFRAGLIAQSYWAYLGRAPEASGSAYWLDRLNAGSTQQQLEAGFMASGEYFLAAGSNPATWVSNLYRDILHRAPSPAEVTSWTGRLDAGDGRYGVALGFTLSTEHLSSLINAYYVELLGRSIDPTGAGSWVGAIQRGTRVEDVIAGVVSSDEYVTRNGGGVASASPTPAPVPTVTPAPVPTVTPAPAPTVTPVSASASASASATASASASASSSELSSPDVEGSSASSPEAPRLIPVAIGNLGTSGLSPSAVSPWAVAVSHGSSWAPNEWVRQVAAAGVTVVRAFADDPSVVASQTAAGLTLTGFLQWGPPGQALTFPVGDMAGWRAYVTRMVSTYPDVDHWEVWNEPPNFTTDTDPAHYAQIVVAAYDTVKSINPGVQVGLAAKSTDIRWMAEAIKAGAAGHFDYITLHPYERIGLLIDGNEASYLGIVPTVRAMLADVAPGQVGVPIRFTEAGIPTAVAGRTFTMTTVSPQVQAETLVKVYAMGIAQGVESIAWFDPYDGDYVADAPSEPPFGLIAKGGTPRPAYSALSSLIANLGSRPTYAGMLKPDNATFEFGFVDGADTVLVAWSGTGTSLTFAGDVAVTDPATGSVSSRKVVALGASPVLIRVSGIEAALWVESAQNGAQERSGAALASGHEVPGVARLSAQDGDLGVALAQSQETRMVDGQLAYVMSGTQSVKFVVDPAFSAWDRTPVTVTAVVHRLGGSPGFNLKYDADAATSTLDWAGQRSRGEWRSVPGDGWVTLTWTLDDASFVGKYGFGLRLDSDSTAYSDYALTSLTITKG